MNTLTEIKRRPGRPKLPPGEKMPVIIVHVTETEPENLDALSLRYNKSLSQLTRDALDLLTFVYARQEESDNE